METQVSEEQIIAKTDNICKKRSRHNHGVRREYSPFQTLTFPFEIRGMLLILLPRVTMFLQLPVGHGFLRGFREFFVPEPAKIEDKAVLPNAAGVQQTQTALSPALPFPKSEIIKLPEIFRDNKGRDSVFQTLLQQNEPPDPSVAVLERMNLLEVCVEVDDILERLAGILIPRKKFHHLPVNFFRRTGFHFADHIVEPFVIADHEPVLAAVAGTALELSVQHLDIALGQCRACRFNNQIDTAEVVCGLYDIIDRQVTDCLGLEDPAGLFMGQTASFHVVRVICEIDLELMVKSSGDMSALFRFQDVESRAFARGFRWGRSASAGIRQALPSRFTPGMFPFSQWIWTLRGVIPHFSAASATVIYFILPHLAKSSICETKFITGFFNSVFQVSFRFTPDSIYDVL